MQAVNQEISHYIKPKINVPLLCCSTTCMWGGVGSKTVSVQARPLALDT